ncbi:HNH endonuclease signature motif containing protein [Roseateles saccharophilus]|uniref:HNH endonuclease n=2 Tax=Roseateles saccharophilus TaxID=304 RepID=A0A4R3UMV6_ROSSA|nr:HNH endonuclease signature motif containing protein [Roseateles saccharophilus]TCU91304.1 HNH endonuclease [Roseateles saccharophilus]
MLRRPIMGGIFGQGEFELATQPTISAGLHAVRFMVIQPRAGRILAISESKTEALAGARRVLRATGVANDEPRWVQPRLWSDAELSVVSEPPPRPVSRRRRDVFVRSGGCCAYCGTPLRIDGAWHVEHQLPRALGGTDEALNLVAACERCNLQKSDRTAIEFMAARAV